MSGFIDMMIYLVFELWSILNKNVEFVFIEVLEDFKEVKVYINYCCVGFIGCECLCIDCVVLKLK